ncbi:MAG TPA: shikimate dehydrogenase [Eudoraea sp.]|nr:shikimate dehydrogenase [Eudoraea sp.]
MVGRNISYSFSRAYFAQKFKDLELTDHSYENFDLERIEDFQTLLKTRPQLKGLNVTIPYKEAVIRYLDDLDPRAATIGAVNTIKLSDKGLKGYNTDAYGFEKALLPLLTPNHKKALILGTGGASKAIAFVCEDLGIPSKSVSRRPSDIQLSYDQLKQPVLKEYTIIINCTPLGTFPDVRRKPDIPYELITPKHILFDLIYNPDQTAFLKEGNKRGAIISNGRKMLEHQAEKAWEIWHS